MSTWKLMLIHFSSESIEQAPSFSNIHGSTPKMLPELLGVPKYKDLSGSTQNVSRNNQKIRLALTTKHEPFPTFQLSHKVVDTMYLICALTPVLQTYVQSRGALTPKQTYDFYFNSFIILIIIIYLLFYYYFYYY